MVKYWKKYGKDFKVEAVRLAQELGSPVKAAKNLGINARQIYRWREEIQVDPIEPFSGKGKKKS